CAARLSRTARLGLRAARRARRRPDQRRVLAEVQRDAPRAAKRAGADPDELAARAEAVEPRRRIGAEAAWEYVALPHLDGQREALQRHERLAQAVNAGAGARVAVDALPRRQEGRQRALVGRLDFLTQRRERRTTQAAQY